MEFFSWATSPLNIPNSIREEADALVCRYNSFKLLTSSTAVLMFISKLDPLGFGDSSKRCRWGFIFLLLLIMSLAPSSGVALNEEGHVLLDFVHNLTDVHGSLSSWNSSDPTPCHWMGIQCSQHSHVLSINLSGKQLRGTITLDVRKLNYLQALNLSSNNFEGEIPPYLGSSASLRIMNLHSNNLSGAIPLDLGFLVNLRELDLSKNRLRGNLPTSLNRLTELSFLNVSKNMLEGTVPEGVLASFTSASFGDNFHLCGYPTLRKCETARFLTEIRTPSFVGALLTNSIEGPTPSPVSGGPLPLLNRERGGPSAKHATPLSLGLIITICVCAFVASKFVLGLLFFWRWSKRYAVDEMKLSGGKMVMFKLSGKATPSSKCMLKKTQKLSSADVIGTGGYGTVYKLLFDDFTPFAVKKLTRGTIDRDRGFEREVETLADIKHRNLVALRGFYSGPHINILIYDLIPNGNLDTWLHDYKKEGLLPLDWETRHRILLGTARGLAYLHHDCIPHIIHRDVKSSNILLDEDMEPHLGDFGLAKLINPQQTHVTTIIAGTLGYLAPEYVDTGQATEKGDVYSFGVVLLEILTGKRPSDDFFKDTGHTMIQWVNDMVDERQAHEVFDIELMGSCSDEEPLACLEIAMQCVNSTASRRPSMVQVVKMIERIDLQRRLSSSIDSSSRGISSLLSSSGSW